MKDKHYKKEQDKYYFECVNCGARYKKNEVTYLCPKCEAENTADLPPKGVLKTVYYYKKLKGKYKKDKFFDKIKEREFTDLLPITHPKFLSWLKVGKSPLYEVKQLPKLQEEKLPFQLFLKEDGQNPTYSFKDRASEVVCAYAKENGIDTIVAASTGNAGSSLAGLCAAQNLKAIIFAPAAAPKAKLTQILMYGAQLVPVDGTYDDAFDLSIEATKKHGWYNRNTAYNPFTIEGKKIVSFEMFQQMKRQIPDRVFVPVGDGCIISGVYKGYEDLFKLGLIEKVPTIVAVQSDGSRNIVSNMNNEKFVCEPSKTVADSISVDLPRNFYMAKKFLQEYEGEYITVSDDEILKASKTLSENTGIFSEPAASAAFAGMLKYMNENKIPEKSKNIVLLTGSGLKDLNSVQSLIEIPKPVKTLDDVVV